MGGGGVGPFGAFWVVEFDEDGEFGVFDGGEAGDGGDGGAGAGEGAAVFVGLGGSGFAGDVMAFCFGVFGDAFFDGGDEHLGDAAGAFLRDDAAEFFGFGGEGFAVVVADFFDDVWLHEDAAVGDGAVGVGHLDHVDGETLAEGVGGEFGFGPVVEVVDFAFLFGVEFDVALFEEAELFEVVVE